MAVLEIALLRLKDGPNPDATLVSTLQLAREAADRSAGPGHKMYYFQQTEDPSLVYIIGSWPSVEYHYEVFIPSPENQKTLQMLNGKLGVEWLLHVDVAPTTLPLDAAVIAIARHFIKEGQRKAFDTTYGSCKGPLVEATEGKVAGGWRIDSDKTADGQKKEEWVLVTGWGATEDHGKFGGSEGFKEYAKIREHLEGFEVKHAKIMNI